MSPIVVALRLIAAAVAGYLLGSIPSGVLVGRIFGHVDPRDSGSGKTGATNVLRALGPGPAVLVMAMDIGKGAAAVLLARYLMMPLGPGVTPDLRGWAEAAAGFAALLGHNFSIFIRFTGGRGVATGGGACLAMNPLAVAFGVVAMVLPIAATRYVSLGSISSASVTALSDIVLTATGHDIVPHAVFMAAGATLIIYSHRDNIQRLMAGTERKLGSKAAQG